MKYKFSIDNKLFDVDSKPIPNFVPKEVIDKVELQDDNSIKITTTNGSKYFITGYDKLLEGINLNDLIGKEIVYYVDPEENIISSVSSSYERKTERY